MARRRSCSLARQGHQISLPQTTGGRRCRQHQWPQLEETQVGSMQAAERRTDLPSKEYPEHVAEPATPGQAASAATYRLGR